MSMQKRYALRSRTTKNLLRKTRDGKIITDYTKDALVFSVFSTHTSDRQLDKFQGSIKAFETILNQRYFFVEIK